MTPGEHPERPVPLVATLPGIGPVGALATAPAGHGLEAALRSWGGGVLGAPVGAAAGGALGAGLGLGIGHLMGGDLDEESLAAMAGGTALAGGALGMGAGGLAGSMMGSRAALRPVYNPDPTRVTLASADPYDVELMKIANDYVMAHAPAQPERSGPGLGTVLGAGAVGAGGYLAYPHVLRALKDYNAGPQPPTPDYASMSDAEYAMRELANRALKGGGNVVSQGSDAIEAALEGGH